MSNNLPVYLFQAERQIGTVAEVDPAQVRANLPLAAAQEPQIQYGERVGAGEVGEFVIVEAGEVGILGRITHIRLPERDRLSVEPRMGRKADPHPVGSIQMMTTVPLNGDRPKRGLSRFPRVGARVYSVDPSLLAWIADQAGGTEDERALRLNLASLPGTASVSVRVTPERLFGRHCAVLGATGGGKSWTLARIVESCSEFNAKVILLDATGEYHAIHDRVHHVSLGRADDLAPGCVKVVLPYRDLQEGDLFAVLRPSTGSQVPKLREAMKSLRLAKLLPVGSPLVLDGCIPKANKSRSDFDSAYAQHALTVDGPSADFDIAKLPRQIEMECVWPSGGSASNRDYTIWGGRDDQAYSYCSQLIARLQSHLSAEEFAPIFQPGSSPSVLTEIETFLQSDEDSVLRISLRNLTFAQNIREVVANGIGRHLLSLAREGRFTDHPLVICVDEAHQFLNKWLGDEFSKWPLDSFDLIAKEGRKYSLSICIATQRPRDIPDAVLGQMGTLIVHRLTNHRDREVVERAAGDVDRSAVEFLPSLEQGQAVLLGVDYPIPLTIQVKPPTVAPDSSGPDFQSHWRSRESVAGG